MRQAGASGRRRRTTVALSIGALLAAALPACDDDPVALPRVSHIDLTPGDTVVAPGDTVRMAAVAADLDGVPVDVPLTWATDDRSVALVDSAGVLVVAREGTVRVSVTEPGGVQAFARVEAVPIVSMAPQGIAFGGTVTLHGAGFGPASRMSFGGVDGRTRSVSPDGRRLDVWVPWDARNGVPTVTLQDGREVAAPLPFFLTGGGDDALEPNSFDTALPVAIPFANPYLTTRVASMDHYAFTLFAPTALTVRVRVREDVNSWARRAVLQLHREGGVREFVGVAPAYAYDRDEVQDAVITRSVLGPGKFALLVFVGPSSTAVDRRYEITVDTVADYALPPDQAEPDDAPFEAPLVTAPFSGRFTLETPWATDYYAFDVPVQSRVEIQASLPGNAGVFLIDGEESVTWQIANGVRSRTYRGVIAPFGQHSFGCTVEPGRYYVGILENGGNTGTYDLSVDVQPTTSTFLNCLTPTHGDPGGATLRAGPASRVPGGLSPWPPPS